MLSLLANLFLVAVFMLVPPLGWAQAVPARLALFQDPAPATSSDQLVLGVTTLEEARRLFPDAPDHPGPMSTTTNPGYMTHQPDVKVGSAVVKLRHAFFLGSGRAVLYFDQHKRLVSIGQAAFAYRDPASGNDVVDDRPWDARAVSRNDFRAHYRETKGEWFDHLHYMIQGPISPCIGVGVWFVQRDGYDELIDLSYHYTCPTQPAVQ